MIYPNGEDKKGEFPVLFDYRKRDPLTYDAAVYAVQKTAIFCREVNSKKKEMTMTKRTREILAKLDEVYTTEYKCYLNHENPGQLLIATMLSAQCTDARVNIVTKDLFVKYPDMQAFANADLKELEQDISDRILSQQGKEYYRMCADGLRKIRR